MYRSPIDIPSDLNFSGDFSVKCSGKNVDSTYIEDSKTFIPKDPKIYFEWNGKKYYLLQYHFHSGSEHTRSGLKFPAEIHWVYSADPDPTSLVDVCCENHSNSRDILVVCRLIKDIKHATSTQDLTFLCNLNLAKPQIAYEYDGEKFGRAIRWLVGDKHIRLDLDVLSKYTREASPLQETNGRMVLKHNIKYRLTHVVPK